MRSNQYDAIIIGTSQTMDETDHGLWSIVYGLLELTLCRMLMMLS